MIETMKSYSKYKRSGHEWLGSIPEGWDVLRAKRLFREVDERSSDGKEELLSVSHLTGVTPRSQKTITMFLAKSNVGHKVCRPGDLVINTMWAWMGALGVSNYNGIVSPAYGVYRPVASSSLRSGFAEVLLRTALYSGEYQRRSTGVNSSRMRLYPEQFLRVPVAVPPPEDQVAIERFLKWSNHRLDRAIRAKRKVIALLNEQKRAIVHRAVTIGLDGTVQLKETGLELPKTVPDHWKPPIKIKFISSLKGRLGWQGLKASEYSDEGPYVLSSAHYRNEKIDWDKCPRVTEERYEIDENIQLSEGDILLMKDGAAMGKLAFVDALPGKACLNSHLLLFRPLVVRGEISYEPKFLFYYMLTQPFQTYVQVNGTGSTFPGVSQEALGNFKICLPSIDEQRQIVRFLDVETKQQNDAIRVEEKQITLIGEYRDRITTDLVTGRLDVREVAKKLADESVSTTDDESQCLNPENEYADEEAIA